MSRGTLLVDTVSLITEECCNCGTVFAFPEEIRKRCLEDGNRWFYCPNGHKQHYTGKTEAQKAREQAERAEQLREAAEARTARVAAELEAVAKAHRKMRVRVANGVCPCCSRTFQNLLAHMKSEHPEFSEAMSLKALRTTFGLTQAQVAQEAGVPVPYVSMFEGGKPMPERSRDRLQGWIETHGSTASQ